MYNNVHCGKFALFVQKPFAVIVCCHSVATRIGCVPHDQKVSGSTPVFVGLVWTSTSGA